MKYLYTILFLFIINSVLLPEMIMSANDNQLITDIKVYDNDSTFRFLYLYDELGNKVIESKYFQQDSIWNRKSLNEWFYDGNKCIGQRERIWKDNNWLISYRIDYEYKNDKLITELHSTYTNGIASNLKKIEFQYALNSILSKKEYVWLVDAWKLSIQTDYSYFQSGLDDSITTTVFPTDITINQLQSKFTYNSKGILQSQLFLEKSGTDWINSSLINWYYLSDSTTIASICNKKWLTSNSTWENTQRIDYEYNDSLNLSVETYFRWSNQYWKNDIRYNYLYDSKNLSVKKTLSKPIYNDWRGLISINYSNFTFNKANEIESKFEFWGGNSGELTTSFIPFIFNNESSIQKGRSLQINYIPVRDSTLYTPVAINSIHMIPVYPNPSEGIFYINTQDYVIKNWSISGINGQILKKEELSFQTGVIDITDFPRGIYILRVATQNEQFIQKLIKK